MQSTRDSLVAQLQASLVHYNNLQANAKSVQHVSGYAGAVVPQALWSESGAFASAAVSAVENATGRNSYRAKLAQNFAAELQNTPGYSNPLRLKCLAQLKGVVDEVLTALMSGALISLQELIRGELFSDYLEMADHLLTEGYKDPAAVVVGTTLEVHLRELCTKNNIATTVATGRGDEPKKATLMNDDLKKLGIYSSLEHKQVLGWQDLRNKAAHGAYSQYDERQVALMIQGIRDFIAKYPA